MPTDVIIDPTNGQIYWNNGGGGLQESISIKGDALNAISFVGYGVSYSPGSTPSGTTLLSVNDNGGTDLLIPGTNGYNLGSSSYRWNTYATSANLSGTLVVSDTTISSSLLTGSVKFNGGIAISGNASIGQSLLLYSAGTAYTFYTGFKAGSVLSNTLYTLPTTYPSTGTSVLQSDTSGIMSWVPMSASSSSGGTISSGVQYQIAGYYSGSGASVSGSSTFTNNTSTGQVQILHTTASSSTATGALQVAGGVGISGKLTFNQAAFGTTGISSLPTMAMIGQTGDPIYLSVLEDNSISFEGSQGQLFSISPNLTTGYIWSVNDISGVPLLRSSVGATIGIAEYGGVVGIGQTNPIYKLDLKGNFGLASSNDGLYNFIFSNSATTGSNSLQIRSANSILFYNSGNSYYTGIKSAASANVTFTLPGDAGSPGQFLQTNGSGTLSWATATGGGGGSGSTGVNTGAIYQIGYYASTGSSIDGSNSFTNNTSSGVVSISHITASTDYSNGALKVSGGVGIGGSLNVGGTGASIVGIVISNSTITRGTWNGSLVSSVYGGTGLNLTGSSGVLTVSSGTVSASTTSSAIASALSDETGSGSLVFNTSPSFGTGVTTGDITFAVFNTNATTINAFGAATTLSIGAASGTATFNSVNNSTSSTNGALVVSGGVGIGRSVSIAGRLQLFNSSTYTAFVSNQIGTGSTVYVLPSTTPATGTSVLQSDSAGTMTWVPMVASSSGAGSGTVAIPDAQYRLAYYAGTGASVSSTSFITAVGNGVTIFGATNASSTTAAALSIIGGLGITGNAFIGGTINVASSSTSLISGVSIANSVITSGLWAATAITGLYGGTGFNTYTVGDILVGAGSSFIKLNSGTQNYVLTSNGTAALPSWQAVPAAAASSVATTTTTSNQSFFITAVSGSIVTGVGLSTISSFVVNPSTGIVSISGLAVTNNTASTNASTGALIVTGGAAVGQTLSVGGNLSIFNGSNYASFRYTGTANTTYTLPGSSPAIGTSVLQSDLTGIMTWVPMVATGGAGSGTVAIPDAQYRLAYYAGTGASVSSTSFITAVGNGVTIFGATNASSTTAAALSIIGGLGITGNAFIGGTINVASTSPSIISNLLVSNNTASTSTASGALIVSGGLGIAGNAFIGGTINVASTSTSTISGISISNSLITSGTWSGSLITGLYGGTGFNTYTVGDVLVGAGSSFIKLNSGTSNYVLTSNGTSQVPSWQPVPSAAASSVAATTTTSNQSFFITAVSGSIVTGVGLSTISSFVVNPSTGIVSVSGLAVTNNTASTNSTSGALIVTGGASVGQTLSVGGNLSIFNGSNYSAFKYTGTANTTYTLPPNSPQSALGTSVLSSNTAGLMTWVAMSGGSATPAGSNKQIQYNNSTAFGGASGFEYTTGGIAVTVSVFSATGTGYTSGLWINAIDGATTRVGIGLSNPAYELEILGEISATNKSFVIDHPTKSGMKLRYGSLEGPENGVYVRGELKGTNIIEVPDHWIGLVHKDSYTVHLTPIGRFSHLYVEKIENYNVYIADNMMCPIHCYYSVWAERKDIPKLITEYEAQ
jgi:ABC-type branched-subunit amino acid transport system ATPase component